jgi:hypothetical protein
MRVFLEDMFGIRYYRMMALNELSQRELEQSENGNNRVGALSKCHQVNRPLKPGPIKKLNNASHPAPS